MEELLNRTPAYDPILEEDNEMQIEGIHKRQITTEEMKVGVCI